MTGIGKYAIGQELPARKESIGTIIACIAEAVGLPGHPRNNGQVIDQMICLTPKLLALLEDQAITLMVVERQDRLTRFGFRYVETLLRGQGRTLEVVNEAGNETEDLMADLTAILSSFTARLYGQRRAKRKTETVMRALEAGESEGEHATG